MNGTITDRLRDAHRVHFDSMTLIYLIERHPSFGPLVREAFALVDAGRCVGLSSFVTLLEVLVKPFQDGRADLAQRYRDVLIGSRGFSLFPLDRRIAEDGAGIRARYGFRTPDAIQLATAVRHSADAFLTNDIRLKKFHQLDVVVLDDFSPSAPVPETEGDA
ncbi:MAG: PIN domain-containing protein [Phycisphaerae bacterium]|nr:PIN domain-containing protein [Phycisphaerae bacterium]